MQIWFSRTLPSHKRTFRTQCCTIRRSRLKRYSFNSSHCVESSTQCCLLSLPTNTWRLFRITSTRCGSNCSHRTSSHFMQAFGWIAILSTLEYIFHRLKGNRHGFALEDAITNYAGGHLQLVLRFSLRLLPFLRFPLRVLERAVSIELYTYVWQHYKLFDLPWHSSITWVVAFILEDLAHYLAHRACHGVFFVRCISKYCLCRSWHSLGFSSDAPLVRVLQHVDCNKTRSVSSVRLRAVSSIAGRVHTTAGEREGEIHKEVGNCRRGQCIVT